MFPHIELNSNMLDYNKLEFTTLLKMMCSHWELHRKAPDSSFQEHKPVVSMDSSGKTQAVSRRDGALYRPSYCACIVASLP